MSFRKNEDRNNELTQNEREAIVDLLHFCLYADSHIALKESEFMSAVIETIGWDIKSSFGSYEGRSISNARAAKENSENRKDFLGYVAKRLSSKESRTLALDFCKKLFLADGSNATKESSLLGEISLALK